MSSKSITVFEVESAEWKTGLDRFHYSLFISPEWVQAVAEEGDRPIFIDLKEGDEIIAKISGLITKAKPLLGRDMLFYAYPALQNEDGKHFDCTMKIDNLAYISELPNGEYQVTHQFTLQG